MDLPNRKPNRLKDYDYNQPGAYFITFCTQNRRCVLSQIVGGGRGSDFFGCPSGIFESALDAPHVELTPYGKIVEKYILSGNRVEHVSVEQYVIMPNHVHMILTIRDTCDNGTSRTPSPTNQTVPWFVSTLKRFCHREMGEKIFQRSFHDHVIRGDADYREIWEYINQNPAKWAEDRYYEKNNVD